MNRNQVESYLQSLTQQSSQRDSDSEAPTPSASFDPSSSSYQLKIDTTNSLSDSAPPHQLSSSNPNDQSINSDLVCNIIYVVIALFTIMLSAVFCFYRRMRRLQPEEENERRWKIGRAGASYYAGSYSGGSAGYGGSATTTI